MKARGLLRETVLTALKQKERDTALCLQVEPTFKPSCCMCFRTAYQNRNTGLDEEMGMGTRITSEAGVRNYCKVRSFEREYPGNTGVTAGKSLGNRL